MTEPGDRPVLKAIIAAIEQRVARLSELAEGGSSNPIPDLQRLLDIQRLLKEIGELSGWVDLPLHGLPDEERQARIVQLSELMREQGLSLKQTLELTEVWKKRPRGRPPIKRVAAVRALEMKKYLKPKRTFPRIVRECCPCSRKTHGLSCVEVMRQEVMALERLLKKFGITPTPEPNSQESV